MKFRFGAWRASCIGMLSTLLASCGGESLVAFNPARLLVFGDQASVVVAGATPTDGRKYTVNYADPVTGAVNCGNNPIWVQVLANAYSISFPECPQSDTYAQTGQIHAIAGAQAGGSGDIDLTAQITRQLERPVADGGGIGNTDLVAVYAGVNDIVAAYERFKAGGSYDASVADVENAGETFAAQINRIAAAGGRVIVSTVPDVGVTPYAISQGLAGAANLTYLTGRFNARMLVTINNNGRLIGLIELNPYLASVVANAAAYGYANVVKESCEPVNTLACTTSTVNTDDSGNKACFPVLNTDGTSTIACNWLWASKLELGPLGNAQLGALAASRARNQPF